MTAQGYRQKEKQSLLVGKERIYWCFKFKLASFEYTVFTLARVGRYKSAGSHGQTRTRTRDFPFTCCMAKIDMSTWANMAGLTSISTDCHAGSPVPFCWGGTALVRLLFAAGGVVANASGMLESPI